MAVRPFSAMASMRPDSAVARCKKPIRVASGRRRAISSRVGRETLRTTSPRPKASSRLTSLAPAAS